MFEENDIVRLKKSYCEEGEEDVIYIIRNINTITSRAYIEPINMSFKITPQELVDFNMIEKIK